MNERFHAALNAADADKQLIRLIREMERTGQSQAEIYRSFEAQLVLARDDADETNYDALADVMDRIVGWCGPDAKTLTHYLTNDEIERSRHDFNSSGFSQ